MKGRWSNETNKQEPVKTGRWSADVDATRQRAQEAASRPIQRQSEPVQRDTHETVMDMAINSLRNRVANSSVGRSMGDWAKNAAETYTNHKQIKDWLRNTPEGQKYLIDYNKSEEERQKAKEIKRQQDAITLAQDIDVASSLYEPPTKRELVKVKDTNMDNADMFSNDWEPVAGDEHEEWRTVQNERYNPLAREERDALIDSYYKAMMGGVDSETYHQIMVDVAQNGGIQQLVAEQKADAESDRNYLAKLNYGINLDDMSLLQRAGKTAGNLLSGTEKQWLGQQMAGIETMVTPPEAMSAKAQTETFQADRDKVRDAAWDYVSALVGRRLGGVNEQEVSAARNALNSTVMGDYYLADETYDPNLEMGDPRNAAWLRVADQLNAVADRIAEGDSSITKDNILDFIQGGNLSEQVKKAFNDDQFQAAYENLLRGGAEDLDLAKAYNPIAGGFGDMVIDAASSSLSSAQSVLLSRMLLGGAISGVSNLQTRVIDKLAKSGAAKFLVNGAGFVGNRIQDILGMAAFGTGAYGASANEARQKMLEQGIDIGLEEARKIKQYAAANTGIEFGSEMLFSSIGAIKNASGSSIFNGFADEFGEALSGFVSTPRGKAVVGTIGKLIGGGVEEGLEEVIGDFVRDVCDVGGLVGDENKTTFEEYLKDFLVGAMSGLMGEVTSTVYSPLQRENIGKQVKAGEATLSDGTKLTVQDMVNLANSEGMEGTTLAKTYNDLFKGLPRSIDSFTNKEVGRLYEAYEETLGKSEEAINRVQDTLDKFESGEELRRSDINKITNNADAVRYLQSAAGTELNLDGSITERKAAVEDALRAIASQNETLREALTENVSPDAENANMGDLEARINALPIMNRQAMPNEIASGYFQDSTRDTVRNAAQQMGIGEEGQNIMAGLYSGNRENAIDYVGEMTKYYNQGKENKELNFEEIAGNNLANDQQSLAAWRAGRADYLADMARRETNNERAEGQADLLRDGTERMDGENSVRESAAVGEVAGGAEVRQTGFQQRGTGAERVYSGSKVGARLTESQLNARDIAAAGYNVVTGNNDVEANNVKNYVTTRAAKNGINVRDVILFRGAMLDVNGARERGFFIYHPDGSVTIAAQLDNEDATGEQIATHEFTHALIKKMSVDLGKATKDVIGDLGESGEVSFGTIRDYMAKELGGQDRLVQAVNAYAAVYKAAGAIQADENGNVSAEDMRMVFEEMICDFVAGMNAFAEVGHVSQAVRSTPVMAAAKKAVEKMANETRGSPSATEINNGYTARAMEETVDNPVKASISIADAVAERSVAAVPKDNETLQAAVQKAHDDIRNILIPIVKPLMGKMDKNGMPLVPEESSFSPNIFSNGSSGFDAEPTTECYRQMGYRALAKMVTDKLGRPLTNIEAIIVNQAAVEIAIDPPCLYCYSLLDRKAKEAYKIQYLNERDSFEQMFERDYGKDRKALLKDIDKQLNPDINSGSYYSIYLNNGKGTRTDNKDKRARVRLWMEMWANNVKGVTLLDVRNMEAEEATAKHINGIENKTVRNYKKESLKDVQKWVQAASQAKKYIPYSAYTNAGKGNLLSWKKNRIDLLNSEYGLRWYSHADFHPAFAIDNMQQVIDASVRGLKGLMYCKPIAAAKIMAPTGMNINVSCFAQFKDGKYISDDKLGANWDEVKELRKKYNNVGSVMVVTSDDMLLWALSQDWVDVVIPLHRVRSGSEFIQEFGLSDYTGQQADKADKAKFDEFMAAYASEHQLTDRQAASAGKKMKSVYPAEHQNDYDTYLKICQERGLTPRFEKIRSEILTGNYSYDGVQLTPAMYMKLVNETRQSESQTQPLQPVFDMDAAKEAVESLKTQGYFEYFKDSSEWNGKRMTLNDWADQAVKDIEAGKKPSELGYGRDLAVNEKGQYIVSSRQAKAEGLSGIHKASLVLQYLNGDTEVVNKPSNITENQARYYLGLAKRRVLDDDSYIPVKRNTSKVVVDSLNAAGIRVYDDPLIMSVRKARQAQRHTDINNEEGHKLGIDEIIMLLSRLDSPAHIIYQTNRRDKRTGRKLPNNVAVFVAYPDGGKERFAVVEFDADIRENVFVDDGDNNFSVVVTLFVPGPKTNKAESGEAGNDKENNEMEEYDYYLKLLSSPDNREIPIKYRDTDATGDNGEIVPDAETTDISVQHQYGTGGEESQSLKTGNPVAQAISSADTSLNQVPALHKDSRVEWGKTNIDIGAGAYEAATEYLKEKGVTNLKWDPYNQSKEVNRATLKYLQDGNKADTATNANVLNVIAEKDARLNVVLQAAKSIKPDGKAYFMVYEGDGSGIGRRTSKGWQNNLKTKEYADEIRTYFNDVQVKGKLIVASNPKANLPMASWEVTPGNAVKFSTSLSSAYMAAAERGDTETAQRLVDEAAEEAMPNSEIRNKNGKLLKVYHGTDADFNVFDTTVSGGKNGRAEGFGIYLSPDQEVTKSYGDRQIGMFANITKPAYSNRKTISVTKLKALLKSTCEAEAKEMAEDYGGSVKDALKDTWISNYVDTYSNSMEIAYTKAAQDILRMNGSDMEVIQEVMAGMAIREYADAIAFYNDHLTPVTGFDGFWTEWTNRETGKKTPVILAFNSNQLKVADAITRNDDGNIIPLEERFNPKNDDIRFSRDLTNRSSSELYEANRQLQKDLTELRSKLKTRTEQYKYWKGQTKTTEGRQLRIEDVTKLAREIIKGQESSADAKAVADKMKALGEYLLNSQEENVYDEARLKAYEIAHDILANAKALNTKGGDDFYSDFRTALKNQPIYVAPSVREEVAPDGWNDFRKAQYGTVNMTADQSKGKSVDKVYHDLQATFGEWLLPEYITSEADQLKKILEVIETYRPVYENINSYDMADAVEWTANEILTRIIGEEIRETNPTYADRMEKKLADQKMKSQEALRRVREQRDRKVADLKAHYQQVAEDRRNRKIDSEMRTRLLKWARRVNNMKLPRVAGNLRDLMIGDLDTVAKSITGQKLGYLQALEDWYLAEQQNDPNFFQDKEIEAQLKRLHSKHINDLTQEEVADLITILQNFEAEWRHKDTGEMIDSAIKVDRYAAAMNTIDDVANTRGRRRGKGGKADRIAQTVDAFFVDNQLSPTRAMKRITGYHDGDPLSVLTKEVSDGYTKKIAFMMEANRKFDRWLNNKKFCRALMGKHARTITVRGAVGMTVREFHITPAMGIGLYLASMNDDNMRHIAQGGIQIADLERYRKGDLKGAFDTGEIAKFTREAAKAVENQLTDEEKAFAKAVYEYYNIMAPNAINDVSEVVSGYAKARVKNYYPIRVLQTYLDKNAGEVREGGTPGNAGFLNERTTSTKPIVLMDVVDVLRRSIDENSTYVGLEIPIRNFNLLKNTRVSLGDGSLASVQDMIQRKWGDEADKYISKMISDVQGKGKGQSTIFNNLVNVARGNQAKAALHLNAGTGIKQAASLPTAAAVLGTKPIVRSITTLARKVDPALIRKYTPLYDYRALGYSTPEIGDIREKKAELPKALKWIEAIDLWTVRRIWRASEYYVLENNKNLKPYSEEFYKEVKDIWEQTVQETQPNYTPMQRSQSLRSDGVERVVHLFKTQPYQNFNILYDAFAEAHAKRVQMVANTNDETKANYKKAKTGLARAVGSQIVSSFVFALMQYVVDLARGKKKKYQDDDGEDDILAWMKAMGLNMLSNGFGVLPLGSLILEGIENAADMALKAMGEKAFFGQKYYGLSDPTIDAINDAGSYLGSLINKIGNYANGNNSSETFIRNMVDAVSELSALAGIPVGNGLRTLQSITRIVLAGGTKAGLLYDGNMLLAEYNALRLTTDPSKYANDYYDLLWKAYNNDRDTYNEMLQMMLDDKSEAFTEKKIKDNFEKRMKEAQGVTSVSDLESRWMAPKTDNWYLSQVDMLEASDLWEGASYEAKNYILDKLVDLGMEKDAGNANGAKFQEQIDAAAGVGIDEQQFFLFNLAYAMQDKDGNGKISNAELLGAFDTAGNLTEEQKAFYWKTFSGIKQETIDKAVAGGEHLGLTETEYLLYKIALTMTRPGGGSPTNDETEKAIRMVTGLTPAERAYLWEAQGKNAKSNPFK